MIDTKLSYMVLVSAGTAYGSYWVEFTTEDEAKAHLASVLAEDPWGRHRLYEVRLLDDVGDGQRG